MVHVGPVTATVFREFFRCQLQGTHQSIFVVVHDYPIYQAKHVRYFVNRQNEKLMSDKFITLVRQAA